MKQTVPPKYMARWSFFGKSDEKEENPANPKRNPANPRRNPANPKNLKDAEEKQKNVVEKDNICLILLK